MVRSRLDGQLGEMVERDGIKVVKLDRPGEDLFRPYSPEGWITESEHRPLNPSQISRIAYEADRALRLASGHLSSQVKDWLSLKDEDRIKWIKDGPPESDSRRCDLYDAIIVTLGGGSDG